MVIKSDNDPGLGKTDFWACIDDKILKSSRHQCMLRIIHCCAFQGGRGNNVQFMAINNDVLFPCEMAW